MGTALCSCEERTTCNVLCERNGRQKAHLALASGTKQKTEDFCLSQKTGFCFVWVF